MKADPRAEAAGVRKVPRHEVAVGGARAGGALWGFQVGAAVDGERDVITTPAGYVEAREVGKMPWASQ